MRPYRGNGSTPFPPAARSGGPWSISHLPTIRLPSRRPTSGVAESTMTTFRLSSGCGMPSSADHRQSVRFGDRHRVGRSWVCAGRSGVSAFRWGIRGCDAWTDRLRTRRPSRRQSGLGKRSLRLGYDTHGSGLERDASVGEELDRLGIGDALLLEDAGGEGIRRVAGQNRRSTL